MGRFEGLGKAEVSGEGGGGKYFAENGKFSVTVTRVFFYTSRKKQDMVILDCRVEWSNLSENPTGSQASYCIKASYPNFDGMLKAALLACMGVNPTRGADANTLLLKEFLGACGVSSAMVQKRMVPVSDITDIVPLWEATGEAAVNEDPADGEVNPCAGARLRIETVGVDKKNSDGRFTQHFLSPWGDGEPAEF